MVDVKKGSFNSSDALEGADYDAPEDGTNVTELAGVGSDNWVEAEMHAADANAYINTTDRTQFRLYFPQAAGTSKLAGWNSGESTDNEPQLIVRYE